MTKLTTKNMFVRAMAVVVLAAVLAIPATATSGLWKWADRSALLPYKDGVSLSLSAERAGNWLLSDGTHLYRFDGVALYDLTPRLRERGIQTVANLYSDDRSWLVVTKLADQPDVQVWQTDGESWNDVTGKFPRASNGIDFQAANGTWFARSYARPTASTPSMGEWSVWYAGADNAERLTMPSALSTVKAGCFVESNGSKLCSGEQMFALVNGNWYVLGGSAESVGFEGRVTQKAVASVWRLDGKQFVQMSGVPNFKFISGVWSNGSQVLVATSDSIVNPLAPNKFWTFDGTTWRDVSTQALSMGLLSVDVREIDAAWNGKAWMILAGKKIVRFDGETMNDEGYTRDVFQTISSNGAGLAVLGGALSNESSLFPTNPLTAHLATVEEDLNARPTLPNLNGGTDVLSVIEGPSMIITKEPVAAVIGDGKLFTFRAMAQDKDGVERVEIYVNGARVKSCTGEACEYTQTYWTNGAANRTVSLYARAIDKQGYARESERVKLVVDAASSASAVSMDVSDKVKDTPVPSDLVWTRDAVSDIGWADYTTPKNGELAPGKDVTFIVAANAKNGLASADIWVNGQTKRHCEFGNSKATNVCAYTLKGSEYMSGDAVFVNANVFDARGKNAWTSGGWIKRGVATVSSSVDTTKPAVTSPAYPTFYAHATIDPASGSVRRGETVTFHATAQNNVSSLHRVDIYLNGQPYSSCSYGAVVSAVTCDATVNTATYAAGTNLNFMVRAISVGGQELWGDAKSVTIKAFADNVTQFSPSNGASNWIWMTPSVSLLTEGQTTTYYVGAWSPDDVTKIEIMVDGMVRRACVATSRGGNKECSYEIVTSDYSQGHTVAINARITDAKGNVMWSEPRSVLIKRSWEPLPEPGPYVSMSSDHPKGYLSAEKVTFTARAWSPAGIERVEIYANGTKVATCSSDVCAWTSQALLNPFIEYQARLVDRSMQETWTPLQGLMRK